METNDKERSGGMGYFRGMLMRMVLFLVRYMFENDARVVLLFWPVCDAV